MSPTRRREVLHRIREDHPELSERHACRLVGLCRGAVNEPFRRIDKDKPLVSMLMRLVQERPRSGYRMLHGLVRDEGFRTGRDRVYRLCRKHGLGVPRRKRMRRAMGSGVNAVHITRAIAPNHVWTWDFVSDQTMNDGRSFKVLTVVDEFTRRPLLTYIARRINAREVIRQLVKLFDQYGVPGHIRSDNGPEFIAKALQAFLRSHAVKALYIAPGSPWQNGIIESFNGRLKDECMNIEAFMSLEEARVVIDDYRRYYLNRRPHSSLNYRAPAKFLAAWQAEQEASGDRQRNAAAATEAEKTNRADGEGDAAPLLLQTSTSTPHVNQGASCQVQSQPLIRVGS